MPFPGWSETQNALHCVTDTVAPVRNEKFGGGKKPTTFNIKVAHDKFLVVLGVGGGSEVDLF